MSGIQEILIGPSRRWRENALRNLPYMPQRTGGTRQLKNFPVLCRIRQNINRLMGKRRFFGDVLDRPIPTLSGKDISLEALASPVYRNREVRTSTGEIVIDRPY